ncbi:MAG: QueT transporter family protein [Lachnospiraceae bacterium]|nr:QueT transporter family protein [Lachnospiraceae bacterium]
MKNRPVLYLTYAAMIAALYVVLTMLANVFGLANGSIQLRFSEALTILPYFTPTAIPGLFVGCLISNVASGAALPDIIFGSMATLLGAIGTYALRRQNKWFAPFSPILANTIIIPFVLKYAYGIIPIWFSVITVAIGEILSCGVLGMLLLFSLSRYRRHLFSV